MNNQLAILVPIIIIVTLFLGYNGLQSSASTATGVCNIKYQKYVVEPFIKNWLDCRNKTPCGTDDSFTEHNAKVQAIQCLCQDQEQNDFAITSLYQKLPLGHPASTNVAFICATGAKEQRRL